MRRRSPMGFSIQLDGLLEVIVDRSRAYTDLLSELPMIACVKPFANSCQFTPVTIAAEEHNI